MSAVHPTIERAMWFAPPQKPAINDDDIYVAQFEGKHGWKIVRNLGNCRLAKTAGANVQVGQALFRGMTLKHLPLCGLA